MIAHYSYQSVSEALAELRKKGYVTDFSIVNDSISFQGKNYAPENFVIHEIYRYEGATDPADESVIYGIEMDGVLKGVLIDSYGAYSEDNINVIKKIRLPH
jgi:hypothetical protein